MRAVKPPPGPPAQMSLLEASDAVSGFVAPDVGSDGSRRCVWCTGPIPASARRDAITCSKPCRQARHRFGKGLRVVAPAEVPLALAYADPPYPGKAHYYRDHVDYGGEVDHRALLERLSAYDGWALSTSSRALPAVLADAVSLELRDLRVAAWMRGARQTKSKSPLLSWEPVVYSGGRRDTMSEPPLDSLIKVSRPRRTDPDRVIGAKPADFVWWLFDLLGAKPGDRFDDLFPGSGGVGRAWAMYDQAGRWGQAELERWAPRTLGVA